MWTDTVLTFPGCMFDIFCSFCKVYTNLMGTGYFGIIC